VLLNNAVALSEAGAIQFHPFPDIRPRRRVWGLDVLVVDDDPADTALILDALNRNPQVTSARATAAPDFALRQFTAGSRLRPNLVLLDIHMPKLDGFAFLAAMRRIPAMATVPVVFLTTSGLASDVQRTQSSSAALYLLKPDSNSELQSRINGVIRLAGAGGLGN
jgi:two-component system, sensor histidine kinase and response regulator